MRTMKTRMLAQRRTWTTTSRSQMLTTSKVRTRMFFGAEVVSHARSAYVDEGEAHLMELSKLAEKDPEFFKYLQENDRELLEFSLNDAAAGDDEDMEGEGPTEEVRTPVLTKEILQKWQKALLDVREPVISLFCLCRSSLV